MLKLVSRWTGGAIEDLTRVETGIAGALSGERLEITLDRIHTVDKRLKSDRREKILS